MSDTLNLAFVWHMHQPYYKNILTQEIPLPWVRMHGIKDYYDMAAILEKFPAIHQTFNLVPSLIEQLTDYAEEPQNIRDVFLDLSRKNAASLSEDEKYFIISNFFLANWDMMIKPYPRYYELLEKRGMLVRDDAKIEIDKFSVQELLDLQVWFNLAWFDPMFKENDPLLKRLLEKKRNFSEEDKKLVLDKQLDVLSKIIPEYKKLQDMGQIEVSISPYYHPILPLLCNSDIARVALPSAKLPKTFCHPEDAHWQVQAAVELYYKYFHRPPRGMWPSEGSVSEDIIPIIAENGIKWIASDEAVLFKSLAKVRSGEFLYKPYQLEKNGRKLKIIFRDHSLSDMIGFVYCRIDAEKAADDFLKHLRTIREYLQDKKDDFLVSIIMDGENAWEFYKRDGWDFLTCLYERLSKERGIVTTTVSDFLEKYPSAPEIKNLYPASWINANFATWIGRKEKNTAWDYLNKARSALANFKPSNDKEKINAELAWREIYIAEGSDWNWWYGDDNKADNLEEFDRIYRGHLSNVYSLIGLEVPKELTFSIRGREIAPEEIPIGFIKPVIDGIQTDYYEWMQAGFYDVSRYGGTMHRGNSFVRFVYYGFSREMFYLRVDLNEEKEQIEDFLFEIDFLKPEARIDVSVSKGEKEKAVFWQKDKKEQWQPIRDLKDVAYSKILELGIELKDLGVKPQDKINILIKIVYNGKIVETIPDSDLIIVEVPGPAFDSDNWVA